MRLPPASSCWRSCTPSSRSASPARRTASRHAHDERARREGRPAIPSVAAGILHFFGEIEVVFGLWALVLLVAMVGYAGWGTAVHYFNDTVVYTEPLFVVVIMTLASTRPIIVFAEASLARVARLGRGTPAAWWCVILTVGPLLGSFITEPAAMTICALLLARQFYDFQPSPRLKYATLGLLFVNVSIGGTLTHFRRAADPHGRASLELGLRLRHRSFRLARGPGDSHLDAGLLRRLQAGALVTRGPKTGAGRVRAGRGRRRRAFSARAARGSRRRTSCSWRGRCSPRTIRRCSSAVFSSSWASSRRPPRIRAGSTSRRRSWSGSSWPGSSSTAGCRAGGSRPSSAGSPEPLFTTATLLTAFNDNALITFLATLVPNLTEELKIAIVEGAVVGGGLTVIANAPNPAGQALLARFFGGAIAPIPLMLGALAADTDRRCGVQTDLTGAPDFFLSAHGAHIIIQCAGAPPPALWLKAARAGSKLACPELVEGLRSPAGGLLFLKRPSLRTSRAFHAGLRVHFTPDLPCVSLRTSVHFTPDLPCLSPRPPVPFAVESPSPPPAEV